MFQKYLNKFQKLLIFCAKPNISYSFRFNFSHTFLNKSSNVFLTFFKILILFTIFSVLLFNNGKIESNAISTLMLNNFS